MTKKNEIPGWINLQNYGAPNTRFMRLEDIKLIWVNYNDEETANQFDFLDGPCWSISLGPTEIANIKTRKEADEIAQEIAGKVKEWIEKSQEI